MAEPIDFYFDFSSPYGYLASTEIDALAARHGRSVTWQDLARRQSGCRGDRTAAEASDANRQDILRRVAGNQDGVAAAADQVTATGAGEHRHGADLDEMRDVQACRSRC